MSADPEFQGFTQDTSKFLRGLGRHNDKAWFDAHRDDYEAHYLEPAIAFVASLGAPLARLAPGVRVEPRVNGSIFRIYRDTRFSKDKTPYKDHIDIQVWEGGDKRTAVSGFFLRIRADSVELGVGAHRFDKQRLAAYRRRLDDPQAGPTLVRIVRKAERDGLPIGGEHYKKLPKGVEPASELRDRLMRHQALWSSTQAKLPPEFYTAAFPVWCIRSWRKLLPLHRWLVDELK